MSKRFYCFTAPGLEDILGAEIVQRLPGSKLGNGGRGVVPLTYPGDGRDVLQLAIAEDVFAQIADKQINLDRRGLVQLEDAVFSSADLEAAVALSWQIRPRKVRVPTFRVVAQRRRSRDPHVRRLLGKHVGRAIDRRLPRWRQVDEDALVEIWALQDGRRVLCGIRLSDRSMRHRTYKHVHIPASLRPVVARAMVMLSEPQGGDVFLDPMCGAATILIERGEHCRYGQLLGGDNSPTALEAARANVGPRYKPLCFSHWDAKALPLAAGSATRIVCNLPFGKKVSTPEANRYLYRRFVDEALRVLSPGGIMVLLTSQCNALQDLLSRRSIRWEQVSGVEVLGQAAAFFKVRKSPS